MSSRKREIFECNIFINCQQDYNACVVKNDCKQSEEAHQNYYIKCKNFRQVKFRTINFGEIIFGHIFDVADKSIFGQNLLNH